MHSIRRLGAVSSVKRGAAATTTIRGSIPLHRIAHNKLTPPPPPPRRYNANICSKSAPNDDAYQEDRGPTIVTKTLVLYDGDCALCNSSVQFLIENDRIDRFRFASLQSPFAKKILER
eukprot:GEZU01022193.1.p1 GENE.GEZU01022193.1~~GEZU01022193.1.p1  ORF type:complete len:118 (-),score=15.12 GEZU01022193.1:101-454(-)